MEKITWLPPVYADQYGYDDEYVYYRALVHNGWIVGEESEDYSRRMMPDHNNPRDEALQFMAADAWSLLENDVEGPLIDAYFRHAVKKGWVDWNSNPIPEWAHRFYN